MIVTVIFYKQNTCILLQQALNIPRAEEKGNDLKTNLMMMTEVLQEEIKKNSLKEIQEYTSTKLEEIKKFLKEWPEKQKHMKKTLKTFKSKWEQ